MFHWKSTISSYNRVLNFQIHMIGIWSHLDNSDHYIHDNNNEKSSIEATHGLYRAHCVSYQCFAAIATELKWVPNQKVSVESIAFTPLQITIRTLGHRICIFDRQDTRPQTYLEQAKEMVLKNPFSFGK